MGKQTGKVKEQRKKMNKMEKEKFLFPFFRTTESKKKRTTCIKMFVMYVNKRTQSVKRNKGNYFLKGGRKTEILCDII